MLEVFFRLPFQVGLDDRLHHFFLPDQYGEDPSAQHWRAQGPPWIQVAVHNVPAPWQPVFRPGFFEGLRALLGSQGVAPGNEDGQRPVSPDSYDSWVAVLSPAVLLAGESDLVDGVLQRGLTGVNRLLRAYRRVNPVPPVHVLAIEDLDPLVAWRLMHPDGSPGPLATSFVNTNFALSPPLLDTQALTQVDTIVDVQGHYHLFTGYRDWFEQAKHDWQYRGDLSAAIIGLQTAIEVLLVNILMTTHIDEGISSADFLRLREQAVPFETLLSQTLPPLLGGDWTSPASPITQYRDHLYRLRNRVVHAGVNPDEVSVQAAFTTQDRLMDFLSQQLYERKSRFPRTLAALLGEEGLSRRGWLVTKMRALLDQLKAEPAPFWLPVDVRERVAAEHTARQAAEQAASEDATAAASGE